MTSDDIIPVLAKILENDATILDACYSNITIGYPATLQDSKLTAAAPTGIWIRDLDKTEEGYLGSASHCEYLYDILFQVDVISVASEATATALRRLVEYKLKSTTSATYGGDIWSFGIYLQSSPGARYDDDLSAWVAMLRMRVQGIYVAT